MDQVPGELPPLPVLGLLLVNLVVLVVFVALVPVEAGEQSFVAPLACYEDKVETENRETNNHKSKVLKRTNIISKSPRKKSAKKHTNRKKFKFPSSNQLAPRFKPRKSYKCKFCRTIFKKKGNLKQHIKSVHDGTKTVHDTFNCEPEELKTNIESFQEDNFNNNTSLQQD